MDIQTELVLLIGLRLGRINQPPTAQQRADLIEQVKGYLLDQQVWPSEVILHQASFWMEEGNRLRENGTLSEEIALSTELALRIGLALGHLKHPISVPRRVELRRQIKTTLRSPHRVAADQLTRHIDRLIGVALFHLERQAHPVYKQRDVVEW